MRVPIKSLNEIIKIFHSHIPYLPGTMLVVAGNKPDIPILDLITVRFIINTRSNDHESGVVNNLSIDMLIGGEFLRPQERQIMEE